MQPATPLPDSRPLFSLISRTRLLLRSSWVATGLGITLGLLLGILAIMCVVDLFVPLEPFSLFGVVVPIDPILRTTSFILVIVPALLAFFHGVVRPLWRRLGPVQVARRIEEHIPGMHNRLVSAVDLQTHGGEKASPVFLRRLLTEALDRIRNFRPRMILDVASLRRAAVAASLAIVLSTVVWGLFHDRLPTALARIFMPWADIPPASGVAYTVSPGKADLLRDEEITFAAEVTKGDPRGLRLELYGSGTSKSFPLTADKHDGNVYRVTLNPATLGAGFEDGFKYRVYGGRTWSKRYDIALVDRPVIAGVQTTVYYPKYMRLPEPHPTPAQAVAITGPEGSEVKVVVKATGDVDSGEVQLLERTYARIPLARQQERAWFEDKIPTGASPGGTWNWTPFRKRQVHTEPASPGTHGHWFSGDPVGQAVGKGDVLFAYVFIKDESRPETIMLEWHDGDGWEHRAFWGADRIKEGKLGTASRYRIEDLPESGKWVRLEVPAAKVGLEGKVLKGIGFKLHGGAVLWGQTGTVQVQEPAVRVIKSFPMKALDDDTWSGSFKLKGSGLVRAELRNKQGHPNKPMKELRFIAIEDRAPYVVLERKNSETILSKPIAMPLTIGAFDDYGLDEIRVLVRSGVEEKYSYRTLWKSKRPPTSLGLEAELTESKGLKLGDSLRYLIEAVDTKGQKSRTREYTVRIAADNNAADQELDRFDKAQDTFQDRLAKLLAEQKKVRQELEKAEKEHAKILEKAEEGWKVVQKEQDKQDPKKREPLDKALASKLTKEDLAKLAKLQAELAKLAGDEARNADTAKKINEDLKKSIDQAGKMDLLPKPLVNQMTATQKAFEKAVQKAMENISKDLKSGSDLKQGVPDVGDLKKRAGRTEKELEGIKKRLDALSKARKGLKDDIKKAIQALSDKMLKEAGKMTARDLEDLKDFIKKLREQLKSLKAKQDELADKTDKSDDAEVKKLKGKQEDIEKELKNLLAKAKKLLDKGKGKKPEFPDAPYDAGDEKETKTPPREQDSDEPLPTKKDKKKDAKKKEGKSKDSKDNKDAKDGKDTKDEEEEKFMPRLGGPKQKLDKRFAKKQRPMKKSGKKGKDKDDLQEKQDQNSKDLDSAEKSLEADQKSVENLLDKLKSLANAKSKSGKSKKGKDGKDGKDGEGEDAEAKALADQLRDLMKSKSLKEALKMAAAAQAAKQMGKDGKGEQQSPPMPSPMPMPTDDGNLQGGEDAPGSGAANLSKFDPDAQKAILRLPKQMREELLRGLDEKGPAAYQAFIKDYFKRLTKTKKK